MLRTQGVIDAFNNPNSATFGYRFNNNAANTDAQRASLLTHGISSAKTKLDVIEVAENGLTATACLRYAAETERPIEPACPLVEMARAQGGGVLRQGERGVLEGSFVKVDGAWKIATVAFAATSG